MPKIVCFHMNQLGDLLFSLPVLKAAKEEMNAEIFSVVKPSLAPLLASCSLVDGVISKDSGLFRLVKELKKEKFEKALLFSESPSSLMSAFLAGIESRTGFESSSFNFLLTQKSKRDGVPSLANNKELGKAFGLNNIKDDYSAILKIPEANIENVRKWFAENELDPGNTIAISAGASKKRQNKCLQTPKWVEVIDALYQKGFTCILSGASWEKEALSAISAACKSKPKLFTAEGGILDSAAFLQSCRLFVGTDSGAMHLAAALGTKCVGIFGPTDPNQIGPMPLNKHVIIKKDDMSQITPSDILDKIIK
ncbi:MAG: hypothetical protein FWC57_06670 [Endomicrobia bacterium]|nr:hypothetical protein [Endomicrobiia bacterium]